MLPGIILGGGSFDPIINGISGRTKMLKQRVNVEEREALMQSIKGRMAKDFFESHPLGNHLRMDFFISVQMMNILLKLAIIKRILKYFNF